LKKAVSIGSVAAFLVLVGVSTVVAAGCGTTTTKNTAAGGKKARLGDALTLEGFEGVKMAVTPTKVIDPLPVGQFDSPIKKGSRFVGVNVVLKNVGTQTYSDSPSNGARIITSNNRQADSTLVSGGPCAEDFSAQTTVSPKSTVQGCIPFEVPGKQPARKFQFTLESGFGPEAGEWIIK
jgi:Domain of unknown function (DUF4352)